MRHLITPTLCLLLAACGGGGSDSPEPTAVSPSPAAPVAAPAPAPTPPVAAPPASAPPAQTPNPPPAAPAAPQQPIAPSPVPTPNPAPIDAPAPVAEMPTPVPEPVVTVLWCVVQGQFEPVRFTITGPGQPWTTLRAESAGQAQYWRSGTGGWAYQPASHWTMLVTDPDGAIAASGDYDIRGDASAYWVGIGWRDAWSSTGPMSAQVRVTGYAFEGGQLIAAEMALPNPRDGSMLCRLDWDALHQQ